MTEESRVNFLIKAASALPHVQESLTQTLLKSYYLMHCRLLAKDRGLPDKYFSSKVRCSHCLMEWDKSTKSKVRSVKLSKGQRKRIKKLLIKNHSQEYVKNRKDLLVKTKEVEQICSFCNNITVTLWPKPSMGKIEEEKSTAPNLTSNTNNVTKKNIKNSNKTSKQNPVKNVEINFYAKTKDVFSLSNKNNTLSSTVKEQKVIKNNKKKKDKFAGLCQQAVLASVKMKQEKDKQNKLNLFLKPL